MSKNEELIKDLQAKGFEDWQIRHELCARNDHSWCDELGHRCPKSKCAQGDHSHCTSADFQCRKIMNERNPQEDYTKIDIARILKVLDLGSGVTGHSQFSKYTIDELIGMSLPMMTDQKNPNTPDSSGMYKGLMRALLMGVESAQASKLFEILSQLNSTTLPTMSKGIDGSTNELKELSSTLNAFNKNSAAVLSGRLDSLSESMLEHSRVATESAGLINRSLTDTTDQLTGLVNSLKDFSKGADEAAAAAQKQSNDIINENRSLKIATWLLSFFTLILAIGTAWMAYSTKILADEALLHITTESTESEKVKLLMKNQIELKRATDTCASDIETLRAELKSWKTQLPTVKPPATVKPPTRKR